MKSKWKKEFPKQEGTYWFYGYRYGKISCGHNKPELILVKVHKAKNGMVYIADGSFMYKSEVECPHFCVAELPELPEID